MSKDEGQTTFYENKNKLKSELMEAMKKSEVYKKITEAFPDAELVDIKDEGQE